MMRKGSVTKETPHLGWWGVQPCDLGDPSLHASPPRLWKEAASTAPRCLCTSCQHIMVMVATGA